MDLDELIFLGACSMLKVTPGVPNRPTGLRITGFVSEGRMGNLSNFERSGDRDILWSGIMRRPIDKKNNKLRSCDFDPTAICGHCSKPLFIVEATRGDQYKPSTYVQKLAEALDIPAYVCWHDDAMVTVRDARAGGYSFAGTVDEYVAWVENQFDAHVREHHAEVGEVS